MESSVLKTSSLPLPGLRGPSPLLRLAPDERLVALVRRGQQAAFEAIVSRYQARLLAFCRHMLASREDAEDVLQEVFAAAFNAILADEREINVRPWLYRIARNRCLNHLRRQTAIGVDSMDVHFADAGQSTVEKAAGREDFRLLMADIRRLPETQRTALLLREMDALSYEQIAEAMETTVPGVKSLLVRARVALGEAAEARKLTCAEVRLELAAIAEGISSTTAPVRRHVKDCQRCREFRLHLRANNRVLAAALPVGPLLLLKKIALAKLGLSAGAGGASGGSAAASAGAATAAGGAAAAGGIGAASGGFAGAAVGGTLAAKAVAGLAAAALVTAGAAVETRPAPRPRVAAPAAIAQLPQTRSLIPAVATSVPQPTTTVAFRSRRAVTPAKPKPVAAPAAAPAPGAAAVVAIPVAAAPVPPPTPAPVPAPTVQQISSSSVLPPQPTGSPASPTAAPAAPAPVQVIIQSGGAPPAPPTPPAPVIDSPPTAAAPAPAGAAPSTGTSDASVSGGTVVVEPDPPTP